MNEFITIVKENFTLLYIALYVLPLLISLVYFFRNKNSFIYSAMFRKNISRRSPKPGSIKYSLCNGALDCYQKELTLAEDNAIMKLLENFSFDEIKDGNFRIKTAIAFLIKNNALERFIRIILHIPDSVRSDIVRELTNSELQVIMNDFFTLNPGALQLLQTLQLASAFTNIQNLKQ